MKHIFYLWSLKLIYLTLYKLRIDIEIDKDDIDYLEELLDYNYYENYSSYNIKNIKNQIKMININRIFNHTSYIYLKWYYYRYLFKYITLINPYFYKLDNNISYHIQSYI